MLGTFFPWKASTLDVNPGKFAAVSAIGIGLWRFSCCRSFVVVIFVKRPATISMISVIGIALISYFNGGSLAICLRPACPLCDMNSSVAKLCMCARSRTLTVDPSILARSSADLAALATGLVADAAGDARCGRGAVEG